MNKERERDADVSKLEKRIGYTFKDQSLLQEALTHSSFTNESKAKNELAPSNERLEFLGDAVLQIVISDKLYRQYAEHAEGDLTKFRQQLVCRGTLEKVALSISLGDYLYLGKGEEAANGRNNASILADATEALLAAVYLDSRSNGYSEAFRLLTLLMQNEIDKCAYVECSDYKSRLQQFVQQDGNESLSYALISETGPDHDKSFTVHACINSNIVGVGKGHTKREAEQHAARQALILFGERV